MDVHELKVFKEKYRVRGELLKRAHIELKVQLAFESPCKHAIGKCHCELLGLIDDITRCLDGKQQ